MGTKADNLQNPSSRVLDKLLLGDLVIADRGFTIHDGVALKHAQLAIPAFTKGKEQQDRALDLSTCVAPLFHSISFVSIKYTGVGGGGTKVCFCGYVPPGCPKKHPVLERINIQNFLTSVSGCW